MEHAAPAPPASDPDPARAAPARLPWDLHPALTEERLRLCARMLANARRDALAMASYELGDDPWSVGCRAFAFGRHRLKYAAASGEYPWLEVLDDSAHFVFLIRGNGAGVPVRFYCGLAEEPTGRTLRRQEVEAEQLSLALGEAAADGLVFRFAVETGEAGRVERVVFLALRGEEQVECFWPVPLELPAAAQGGSPEQPRLIADDGYTGPAPQTSASATPPPPRPCPAASRPALPSGARRRCSDLVWSGRSTKSSIGSGRRKRTAHARALPCNSQDARTRLINGERSQTASANGRQTRVREQRMRSALPRSGQRPRPGVAPGCLACRLIGSTPRSRPSLPISPLSHPS